MLKKIVVPVVLIFLSYGFWVSPEFKEIAAGVAIFLFGMLSLDEGFRTFSGGMLEKVLQKSTSSTFRSIGFGCAVTTLMQSSGLVSVLAVSFLSAGLINLMQGIGIIFGANIGTTSGAWLMAGLGLKINISAYAMPLLVFGVLFIFQQSKTYKGWGYIFVGLGFLFLGIHHMKEGFETFKETIDLASYSASGFKGIVIFVSIGIIATIAMQSSHATIVLVIAALSVGQIAYESALLITIGANIGTTITAVLGSLNSNIEGKRLAGAHFLFNLISGVIAIIVLGPTMLAVDSIGNFLGIDQDDFTLKLAVFDTFFKIAGVLMFLPFMKQFVLLLNTVLKDRPKNKDKNLEIIQYLNGSVLELPSTSLVAISNETKHLYDIAFKIIANGLILKRRNIISNMDIDDVINDEYVKKEVDVNREYLARVKEISGAIFDFSTRAQLVMEEQEDVKKIYELKVANKCIVSAIKATQHLCKNMKTHTKSPNKYVKEEYNFIRKNLVELLRAIHTISTSIHCDEILLLLSKAKILAEKNDIFANGILDDLIRKGLIPNEVAISLMNDSAYAYEISENLIAMAEILFVCNREDIKNLSKDIIINDEEIDELLTQNDTQTSIVQ